MIVGGGGGRGKGVAFSSDAIRFLFIFMTQTQEWVCSSNFEPECLMPSECRYKAQNKILVTRDT